MTLDVKPSEWDLKALIESWHAYLGAMIEEQKLDLPFERLCFQSQTDPRYGDIIGRWSKMDGAEREAAWAALLGIAEQGREEMLPICVRCGECCTAGSPTLTVEDLELLGDEGIAWSDLVTIRRGEPAHSRIAGEAFYLAEEKVKIREKPGTKVCVLYDDATKSCAAHPHKPAQCRAQACWDPTLAAQQATMQALTRYDIFKDVEVILKTIEKHEERCDFERFRKAFELLRETRGENIDEIIGMLAFDEHTREFAVSELGVPEDGLDLVFGRRLTDRLRLFGFYVAEGEDGTRMLLPLPSAG